MMESPVGQPFITPLRRLSCLHCGSARKPSERSIPDLNMQGGDPIIYRRKLQHRAAKLGSYRQAQTILLPLTAEGVEFQSPDCVWRWAPLFLAVITPPPTILGQALSPPARSHSMSPWPGSKSEYWVIRALAMTARNGSGPFWTLLQVLRQWEDWLVQAAPARVPWAKPCPPLWAPTPCLAPEWVRSIRAVWTALV